ncbi:MAG: hypothetical protein ACI8YO_000201 [Gammaproteobacteria bacterium]
MQRLRVKDIIPSAPMIIRIKVILILIFGSYGAFGQGNTYIGLRSSVGHLLPHSPSMRHLRQGRSLSFEASYFEESNGKKPWHGKLNNPRQGVAVYYLDSGNEKHIGSITSVYGFMDFPIFKSKKISNYFKFGSGISYVEKSFDRFENYQNLAIGSSLNLGFVFANYFEVSTGNFNVCVGLSLMHASSGAFTLPNLGVNFGAFDFRLSYLLNSSDERVLDHEITVNKKWNFDLTFSSGPRAVNAVDKKKYFIHTLQMDVSRNLSSLLSLTGGLDVFHNTAIVKLDGSLTGKKELIQLGAKLGGSLNMDDVSLFLQMGNYVLNESNFYGSLYSRFGGRYLYNDRYILNFGLKTHGAKADNFELGIGYRIL